MAIIIRHTTPADLPTLGRIEATCFPSAEAAGEKTLTARFAQFPSCFFTAEKDSVPVGFINGMTTNRRTICDEMFADPTLYDPVGAYLAVFGLDVLPEHRRQGIAAALVNAFIAQARGENRMGVILTCKEHLIHYYEAFGFRCLGVSASVHGGAVWYDMLLPLREPAAD